MSKRLVVCCDGTWNFPDQQFPTNVTKVALAIAPVDSKDTEQRTFYHRGIGSNRRERIRGGAFGFGLSRDVCDTYRFIVHNYEPGDELFFFGFSRGAFTARSTVGLVRNAGILRQEHVDRVSEAYALYRSRTKTNTPRGREATLFRRSYSYEPRIRFIGVWDTVGALGIPLDGFRLISLLNKRWEFHDTELSTSVDAAYQALAIDEKRGPFKPALWKTQEGAEDQHVEQVWFSGVHSDLGGGYPDHGLSDIALLWMVDRARTCGLEFREDAFVHARPPESEIDRGDAVRTCTWVEPNSLGELHESRKGMYRKIPPFHRSPDFSKTTCESIASSAVTRHAKDPEYAPPEFTSYLDNAEHSTPVERWHTTDDAQPLSYDEVASRTALSSSAAT